MRSSVELIPRKAQLTGILERICQELELTPAQFETAKSRYEAVGRYLKETNTPLLVTSEIYPQGSISIGTTVKPLGKEEYDIDLVCLVPSLAPAVPPHFLKNLIGDHLRSNGRYKDILEEKPRCWRLNYANEFHLDITPTIPNPTCSNGGELVPDKKLEEWKASNPRGYRDRFEHVAKLQPQLLLQKAEMAEMRSGIEDLPQPTKLKGLLKRCVQICKHHRDLWFNGSDLAPISVVITTLAARSYAFCVANGLYETELDFLLDVIRRMPQFIEIQKKGERTLYFIWNETTVGENFAEKWNQDARRAVAFYKWNHQMLEDIEMLIATEGLDSLQKSMSRSFGEYIVGKAFSSITQSISAKRKTGMLGVIPGFGLTVASPRAVSVRPNTFYGNP